MKITYSGAKTPIKFAVTVDGSDKIHGTIIRISKGYALAVRGVQWSQQGEPRNGGINCQHAKTIKKLKLHLAYSVPQILVIQEAKKLSVEQANAKQMQLNREFLLALTDGDVKFGLPNDNYLGYEFIGGFGHHNSGASVSVHLPKIHKGKRVKYTGLDSYTQDRYQDAEVIGTIGAASCCIMNSSKAAKWVPAEDLELL